MPSKTAILQQGTVKESDMKFGIFIRRAIGTGAFIAGIIALILPVLPGWLFIGVGLYFLSLDSPGMQQRIKILRDRYMHFDTLMKSIDARFGKKEDYESDKTVL